MEKLTIQHIAPFYTANIRFMNVEMKEPCTLTGFDDDIIICLADDGHEIYRSDEYTLIPFMHHISCLTKTIQHEGREFIPIVELAKIAYPSSSRNFVLKGKYAIDTTSDLAFGFDDKDFESFDTNSAIIKPTFNQYQLFQKLAEWHINFVGIPEGLYIDKNTLK